MIYEYFEGNFKRRPEQGDEQTICKMTSFGQNPSGFCFLVQIRALNLTRIRKKVQIDSGAGISSKFVRHPRETGTRIHPESPGSE